MAFKAPTTLGTTVEIAELESLALGTSIWGDGSGAPATLSIGANGSFLQALSSESTGAIWRTSPQMVDSIDWTTGVAIDATAYQVVRKLGASTDTLYIGVPALSMIEIGVAGITQMTISGTEIDFQDNIVTIAGSLTATGGGSLTGTWTSLGTVTTLFVAASGVIDFGAGDVTITHSTNTLTFAGGSSGYNFDGSIGITTSGAGATDPLVITYSNTDYSNSKGLIGIRRTGALTGIDTESAQDFKIAPTFTLTEPGSGTFTYYGANIDLSGIAVTAGAGTTVIAALHIAANADADVGTNLALYVSSGTSRLNGRLLQAQGTDVASASSMTLGTDGNSFEITGTTAINLISSVGWSEGSMVTLIFNESVTVNHATATSGANVTILLAAASNFSATANDTLTLILSSTTAGGQAWREMCRTAI